jgi:hypothetical protein
MVALRQRSRAARLVQDDRARPTDLTAARMYRSEWSFPLTDPAHQARGPTSRRRRAIGLNAPVDRAFQRILRDGQTPSGGHRRRNEMGTVQRPVYRRASVGGRRSAGRRVRNTGCVCTVRARGVLQPRRRLRQPTRARA